MCDDDLVRDTFVEWFRADEQRRLREPHTGAPRSFEVEGQVCRTLAELRFALQDAKDVGGPPDLVLIDDRLQPERGGEPVRSALKAVRLITAMFGDARPKCVLHTSDLKPNDIWTFCALGGHNAIDKFRPQERMQVLWDTIDGHRWAPRLRTEVTIGDALGRVLPYMEHPYWKYNARLDLPGLDADVKKADQRLDKAKSRLLIEFGLEKGAEAAEIVAAANADGLVWVPLSHRHLLPEDHPEHRPEAFRHRAPPRGPDR